MEKKGISFELLAVYSQEQIGVSKRMRGMIMNMTRVIIIKGNIDNDL